MGGLHESLVPVSATIRGSAETCHRSGNPPFSVTIIFECTIGATIWVLRPLFTDFCEGVEIRDPARNHRRVGPMSTSFVDDTGPADSETYDTELLRLEPRQQVTRTYTFTTERKAHGLRHNDFISLTVGNTYELTIRSQKWWWNFEEALSGSHSVEEKKAMLSSQPATEWKPNCMTTFVLEA